MQANVDDHRLAGFGCCSRLSRRLFLGSLERAAVRNIPQRWQAKTSRRSKGCGVASCPFSAFKNRTRGSRHNYRPGPAENSSRIGKVAFFRNLSLIGRVFVVRLIVVCQQTQASDRARLRQIAISKRDRAARNEKKKPAEHPPDGERRPVQKRMKVLERGSRLRIGNDRADTRGRTLWHRSRRSFARRHSELGGHDVAQLTRQGIFRLQLQGLIQFGQRLFGVIEIEVVETEQDARRRIGRMFVAGLFPGRSQLIGVDPRLPCRRAANSW